MNLLRSKFDFENESKARDDFQAVRQRKIGWAWKAIHFSIPLLLYQIKLWRQCTLIFQLLSLYIFFCFHFYYTIEVQWVHVFDRISYNAWPGPVDHIWPISWRCPCSRYSLANFYKWIPSDRVDPKISINHFYLNVAKKFFSNFDIFFTRTWVLMYQKQNHHESTPNSNDKCRFQLIFGYFCLYHRIVTFTAIYNYTKSSNMKITS